MFHQPKYFIVFIIPPDIKDGNQEKIAFKKIVNKKVFPEENDIENLEPGKFCF